MSRKIIFAGALIVLLLIMGCAKRSTAWQSNDVLELVHQFPIVGNPLDISIDGNNAYIAQDQGGISILNLSDFTQKWYTTIGSDDGSVRDLVKVRKISVVGEHKFLFYFDIGGADDIPIVDITDTDSLKVFDAITGATQGITDMGFYALSTPQGNNIVETCYTAGTSIYYGRYNGTLWMGQDFEIIAPVSTSGVTMDANYLYVAAQQHGLLVYRRSDQQRVGQLALTGEAQKVRVSGNYAYVAGRQGGFHVVDISDPANPTKTYSYDTTGYASSVDVAEGYAAVSSGSGGVYLFDLGSPSQPKLVQRLTESGYTNNAKIHNGKLIVAARDMGIMVYDITE